MNSFLPRSLAFFGPDDPLDASLRSRGLDEVSVEAGPRVWSFPLLTSDACQRLLDEIDLRERSRSPGERAPNSMHEYGVILEEIGLGDLLVWLGDIVIPFAARLFADTGATELDGRHGFLAEYGKGRDESLGFHVDDSAFTLNLCLGHDFSGSEIYFRGLRCDRHRQSPATEAESFELSHETGRALLHAGRHRHGVHPIRRGARRNLIVWFQSNAARERANECEPWCGVDS